MHDPHGPTKPKNLRPPDGNKKLTNCTLQQAIDSAYATFASVLRGHDIPPSKRLFEEQIPSLVFDLAVGAGWVPITDVALQPDEKVWAAVENQEPECRGRKLVVFGDFMIDAWYREAFLALLEDSISFHSYEPTGVDERMDALPKMTSKVERETLLKDYLRQHAADQPRVKVTHIPKLAGVDYRDFKRWRKGPLAATEPDGLPDSSIKSKRISMLLRHDDRRWSKLKRKPKWYNLSPP